MLFRSELNLTHRIAEWCGWKLDTHTPVTPYTSGEPQPTQYIVTRPDGEWAGYKKYLDPDDAKRFEYPDYLTDLNACAEFERLRGAGE